MDARRVMTGESGFACLSAFPAVVSRGPARRARRGSEGSEANWGTKGRSESVDVMMGGCGSLVHFG
jgi:hypothetical protein